MGIKLTPIEVLIEGRGLAYGRKRIDMVLYRTRGAEAGKVTLSFSAAGGDETSVGSLQSHTLRGMVIEATRTGRTVQITITGGVVDTAATQTTY